MKLNNCLEETMATIRENRVQPALAPEAKSRFSAQIKSLGAKIAGCKGSPLSPVTVPERILYHAYDLVVGTENTDPDELLEAARGLIGAAFVELQMRNINPLELVLEPSSVPEAVSPAALLAPEVDLAVHAVKAIKARYATIAALETARAALTSEAGADPASSDMVRMLGERITQKEREMRAWFQETYR